MSRCHAVAYICTHTHTHTHIYIYIYIAHGHPRAFATKKMQNTNFAQMQTRKCRGPFGRIPPLGVLLVDYSVSKTAVADIL